MCSLCTEGRHHPRAKGPSNLRTLRPPGRSILSTFLYNPLNPLNPLNPHTEGVSKGKKQNDTGRRLAVRIAMGCQIDALPCTPFASSRRSPQGETRSMESENRESYTSRTISQFPPLVAGATTFPPQAGALWMLSHEAISLQESIERFILSPGWGKVRHSRIRGSRVAANH